MACLRQESTGLEFKMTPYKIEEKGQPTWVLTLVELRSAGKKLMSSSISVTKNDLARLRDGLRKLSLGSLASFSMKTSDNNLILDLEAEDRPGDWGFGFWTGEPGTPMKGYHFVTGAGDLERFARDLEADESAAEAAQHHC